MLEFVFEIIADFLFGTSYETVLNKKGPRWLRAVLLMFILLFFTGILMVFVILGISFIKQQEILMGTLFILFGFIFSGLLLRGLTKDMKERRLSRNL